MRRRAKDGAKRRGKPPKVLDRSEGKRSEPHNFVPDAGPGCVIAHGVGVEWALGSEKIDPRDYDRDAVFPDLAVDPETGTLSVVNATNTSRVAYVTVYDHPVLKRDGTQHPVGRTVDSNRTERHCTTFILLLPPRIILHAGTLTSPSSEIDSDVQDWREHPEPEDEHCQTLGFPLEGQEPYLCTQGEGGSLTHFFSGNLHAIDFRCPVGTKLIAVADATVMEVSDTETCTGVATANLFKWNSVMLKILNETDGSGEESIDGEPNQNNPKSPETKGGDLFVEYVHIKTGSVCVAVGDVVKKGQKICESGSVGFSPEPHLHFTAFRSRDKTAATTRVRFLSEGGDDNENEKVDKPFLPIAGRWYDKSGEVPQPVSCDT